MRAVCRAITAVFFVGCFSICTTHAQQDMQFTHYMFSKLYYNPAYAGIDEHPKTHFLHRTQWLGYKGMDGGGAPSTQLLTGALPLRYISPDIDNMGGGFNFVHDKIGAQRNVAFNLAYAYQFPLDNIGPNTRLSVGMKAGFWSQSIDVSMLRYGDLDDVTLDNMVNNGASQLKPDFSLGGYFETGEGHFAGLSFSHAARPNFDFKTTSNSRLIQHMYLMGGYIIPIIEDKLKIKPKMLIATDFRRLTYNISGLATYYQEKYDAWGGLNFRQSFSRKNELDGGGNRVANDAISLIIGASFLTHPTNNYKSMQVSYAIDIVTTGVSAKRGTSHEIVLSYILPLRDPSGNNTPRYIHDN